MLSRVRVRRPKPVALAPWAGTLGQACTEIKANPARGFVGKASRGAHQIRVTSLLRRRAEELDRASLVNQLDVKAPRALVLWNDEEIGASESRDALLAGDQAGVHLDSSPLRVVLDNVEPREIDLAIRRPEQHPRSFPHRTRAADGEVDHGLGADRRGLWGVGATGDRIAPVERARVAVVAIGRSAGQARPVAAEVAGGAGISVIAGGAVEVRVSAGSDGRIDTGIGRALVAVIAEIDIEMAAACSAHTDKAVIASVADLTEESLLHAPPGKIADALEALRRRAAQRAVRAVVTVRRPRDAGIDRTGDMVITGSRRTATDAVPAAAGITCRAIIAVVAGSGDVCM